MLAPWRTTSPEKSFAMTSIASNSIAERVPISGHWPPMMCSLSASPAPEAEPEATREHGSEGGGGVGDDGGVVPEPGAGDGGAERQ